MNARWTLVVLLAAACRTAVPAVVPVVSPPVAPDPHGAVSAKMLADPDAPSLKLDPGEEYIPPQLAPGNPNPQYPIELLALHLPPQTIAVRMTISEGRQVSSITSSPLQESTESPNREAFEQSVRDALRKWVVWPAEIRRYEPGPDWNGDGKSDYPIMTEQCLLKAYYDISFVFEVVDGRAVVRVAQ